MAIITVTTSSDIVNAGDGLTSLREAVALANADGASDTIVFSAGLAGSTITLAGGQLALTNDIIIDGDVNGDNKADITISGGDASRIFQITGLLTDVDLTSLTLTDGSASSGGAIKASSIGSLDLADTTIRDSQGTDGGAIYIVDGAMTATRSLFTGNSATGNGGAIYSNLTSVTLINSTIHDNQANGFGGGISAGTNGDLTLISSTVTGNQADADGSVAAGGGIDIIDDATNEFTITNSVIAENTSGSGASEAANDVRGNINTATNNVFSTNVDITLNNASTENAADVGLGGLADHGGTVMTRNILGGSVLIDAGSNAGAAGLTTDANGGARIESGTVDVGATEFVPLVVTTAIDVVANDGLLSLREAIALANEDAGGDTITFASNLSGQTVTLTSGFLALASDVTIDGDVNGDNKADITISGNNASGIFKIYGSDTDANLLSLTLTGGTGVNGHGGAIYALGAHSVSIFDTTIRDNAVAGTGGGIMALQTTITIADSLLAYNSAGGRGGAIYANGSTVTLLQSTVHDNDAHQGGAIAVTDSVFQQANLYITASTITENHASLSAGGVLNIASTANVGVSSGIVMDNTVDVFGGGQAASDLSGFIATYKSVIGTTPGLGALQDNGGTVMTRAIVADSALINAGSSFITGLYGLATDANGNDRVVAGESDAGAVEFQLVVTTASDVVANDGLLSLREAVALANGNADADSITFDASLAGQTLVLTGGALALTKDVTIDGDVSGDHKADITISGNNASGIFKITGSGTDANLDSLTLVNGATVYGGAVYAGGGTSLGIHDSTISDSTGSNFGGGVFAFGNVIVTNSTISGNTAGDGGGGGIYGRHGNITLFNTTIYGNSTTGLGGGIKIGLGNVLVTNSTVTDNQADTNGLSTGSGGGIADVNSTVSVANSVVAENTSGAGSANDVLGDVDNGISSVFGTLVSILSNIGSLTGISDVKLGELLDNGGTVLTRSPLDGSILIGAGSNGALPADTFDIDHDGNTAELLPIDGRGGIRVNGGTVDIGAVEQTVKETILGTGGNNTVLGGLGLDRLFGLGGNDTVEGGRGPDIMSGGGGIDTLSYSESALGVTISLIAAFALDGDAEGDTFQSFENVTGSNRVDSLTGDNKANVLMGLGGGDGLHGLGGNDTIIGGQGGDFLDGGDGNDTVSYAGSGAVTVNIATNTASGGHAVGDAISGFENVTGSAKNDSLTGNSAVNRLDGDAGADTLNGGGGSDRIIGGLGIDAVTGGTGPDTFVLMSTAANRDLIQDFVAAADQLEISAGLFGAGLAASAPLDPLQFVSNTTGLAGDADDRFIFNTGTGELYFDANGNAAGSRALIAVFLGTLPALTAADFDIVA